MRNFELIDAGKSEFAKNGWICIATTRKKFNRPVNSRSDKGLSAIENSFRLDGFFFCEKIGLLNWFDKPYLFSLLNRGYPLRVEVWKIHR